MKLQKHVLAYFLFFAFLNSLHAQDYTTHYAIVQDLETNLPIDSAHVTLLRDNIPIDSAVTDTNGVAILKAPATSVTSNDTHLPTSFQVRQNYPNPAFQHTNIPFTIARHGDVSYKLYNILGQEVMSGMGRLQPGHYRLLLDGLNTLAKGVYILNIATQDNSQSIKMVNLGSGGQPFALIPKIMSSSNLYPSSQSNILKTTQQNLDNLSLRVSKQYYHQQEQAIASDTTYFALERSHILISGFVYAVDTSRTGSDLIPVADADVWLGSRNMEDADNIRTTSQPDGSFEIYIRRIAGIDTLHAMSEGWNVWNRIVDLTADTTLNAYLLDSLIDLRFLSWVYFANDNLPIKMPIPELNKILSFHLSNPPNDAHRDTMISVIQTGLAAYTKGRYNGIVKDSDFYGLIDWRTTMGGYGTTYTHFIDKDWSLADSVNISIYTALGNPTLIRNVQLKEVMNTVFFRADIKRDDCPESWKLSKFYQGIDQTLKPEVPEYDTLYGIVLSKLPRDYRINSIRSNEEWTY
ncbi:T9SS type A sorting domain-containing protein [candidate division KSB1 bacterium]|nr:T9SS type A sorting domain-containing protein [candidate division KSB1 bacterium]